MPQYSVYIDESGNTGDNLIDPSQPIFTLSGIGISDEKHGVIEEFVEQKKKEYRVQANRLHARDLLRRNRHKLVEEIIEQLLKQGFFLFYVISEREFLVATHIEDDFFDHEFNDRCDASWTHPTQDKRERADNIFKVMPKDSSNVCGQALTRAENFEECYKMVLRDLSASDDKWGLAEKLKGFESHIEEYTRIAIQCKAGIPEMGIGPGVLMAPNYFSLCSLLNKIEVVFSSVQHNNLNIIFHRSRQFNSSFVSTFNRLKNANKVAYIVPGKTPWVFGHENAASFKLSDDSDVLIQCADLVATSINNTMRKVYFDDGNHNYDKLDIFIMGTILTTSMEFNDLFSDWIISINLFRKLLRTFSQQVEKL